MPLGRAIRVKSIIYTIVIGVIEIAIYFTPVIGRLINWIPFSILIITPIGLAWLLADIGTEDRSPFNFFKSFITYHIRSISKDSYFRGRKVPKIRDYQFNNYFSMASEEDKNNEPEIDEELELERQKALRYMERIKNPDGFFKKEMTKRRIAERDRKKVSIFRKFFLRKEREGKIE